MPRTNTMRIAYQQEELFSLVPTANFLMPTAGLRNAKDNDPLVFDNGQLFEVVFAFHAQSSASLVAASAVVLIRCFVTSLLPVFDAVEQPTQ